VGKDCTGLSVSAPTVIRGFGETPEPHEAISGLLLVKIELVGSGSVLEML